VGSSGRFFAGSEPVTRPVLNCGFLVDDPEGYFFVLLTDFFLLSKALLVHGQHVAIFLNFSLSFLGVDDLVKENLIFRVDLNEIFLRTMVIGAGVTFIEEVHVASICEINLWLFGDNLLNATEISRVVIFMIEIGIRTVVDGAVVVESFLHKEELYSIQNTTFTDQYLAPKTSGLSKEGQKGQTKEV